MFLHNYLKVTFFQSQIYYRLKIPFIITILFWGNAHIQAENPVPKSASLNHASFDICTQQPKIHTLK